MSLAIITRKQELLMKQKSNGVGFQNSKVEPVTEQENNGVGSQNCEMCGEIEN